MWHTLVATSGEIVETKAGLVEFITGPRVWVEGDKAEEGAGDQEWNESGPVHKRLVTGVARAVLWPPQQAGLLMPHGHPRNRGHEIRVGGMVVRNFDAKGKPPPAHDR